mmetsp:Transcript_84006/g.242856  ORF Transcript_84006/g.242856 Transcript_84006/m.242856 type:complete len:205 (+) Transcript_84006:706-1320(+)
MVLGPCVVIVALVIVVVIVVLLVFPLLRGSILLGVSGRLLRELLAGKRDLGLDLKHRLVIRNTLAVVLHVDETFAQERRPSQRVALPQRQLHKAVQSNTPRHLHPREDEAPVELGVCVCLMMDVGLLLLQLLTDVVAAIDGAPRETVDARPLLAVLVDAELSGDLAHRPDHDADFDLDRRRLVQGAHRHICGILGIEHLDPHLQ